MLILGYIVLFIGIIIIGGWIIASVTSSPLGQWHSEIYFNVRHTWFSPGSSPSALPGFFGIASVLIGLILIAVGGHHWPLMLLFVCSGVAPVYPGVAALEKAEHAHSRSSRRWWEVVAALLFIGYFGILLMSWKLGWLNAVDVFIFG